MSLHIEGYEKHIIIDEAIINNKSDYLYEKLDLSRIKKILEYYVNEVLAHNRAKEIGFNLALGSTMNIGKLLIVAAKKDREAVKVINSVKLSEKETLVSLAGILKKYDLDVFTEIDGVDLFEVKPEFIMNAMSYVKLMLMRDNKDVIEELQLNAHKIMRVLELYLNRYKENLNTKENFLGLVDINFLYSLGNTFLNYIFIVVEAEISGNIIDDYKTGEKVRLLDVFNDKNAKIIDITTAIETIPLVDRYLKQSLRMQLEASLKYKWIPYELRQLYKISDKIFEVAKLYHDNDYESSKEGIELKHNTVKSVNTLRDLIKEDMENDNKRGLYFTCDDSLSMADKAITGINQDLKYITGDHNSLSMRMIEYISKNK